MNHQLGIGYWPCANGETFEFALTLDGRRGSKSVFRTIRTHVPTPADLFDAARDLLSIPTPKPGVLATDDTATRTRESFRSAFS